LKSPALPSKKLESDGRTDLNLKSSSDQSRIFVIQ
jgi:hypothetical protein